MIALSMKDKTYNITAYNIATSESGISELWVERDNGKNVKVASGSEDEMRLIKGALDRAVELKERILRI